MIYVGVLVMEVVDASEYLEQDRAWTRLMRTVRICTHHSKSNGVLEQMRTFRSAGCLPADSQDVALALGPPEGA